MPSKVPLKDGKLQSVLDLNNYSFINDRGVKRIPQNYLSAGSISISSADIGTFIIEQTFPTLSVTLNMILSGVEPGDWFLATNVATSGYVNTSGSATVIDGFSPDAKNYQGAVHQFIYVGSDTWLQLNFN